MDHDWQPKPIYCPRRHGIECDTPNACAGGADCRFGPDLNTRMNDRPSVSNTTGRSDTDYAIEFGRYLATAAEKFMQSHNECMTFQTGCDCDALCDRWTALQSAIHEFRKRADRADQTVKLVRRLAAQQAVRKSA